MNISSIVLHHSVLSLAFLGDTSTDCSEVTEKLVPFWDGLSARSLSVGVFFTQLLGLAVHLIIESYNLVETRDSNHGQANVSLRF